jgi:hypothetical protein
VQLYARSLLSSVADDLVDQERELHGLRIEFALSGLDLGEVKT